jgi:hypothetical protein
MNHKILLSTLSGLCTLMAHHLKTELFFHQACLLKDHFITVDNFTQSPSQSAKNLGVTLVLWTDTPISAVELCSTFRVLFCLRCLSD